MKTLWPYLGTGKFPLNFGGHPHIWILHIAKQLCISGKTDQIFRKILPQDQKSPTNFGSHPNLDCPTESVLAEVFE